MTGKASRRMVTTTGTCLYEKVVGTWFEGGEGRRVQYSESEREGPRVFKQERASRGNINSRKGKKRENPTSEGMGMVEVFRKRCRREGLRSSWELKVVMSVCSKPHSMTKSTASVILVFVLRVATRSWSVLQYGYPDSFSDPSDPTAQPIPSYRDRIVRETRGPFANTVLQ